MTNKRGVETENMQRAQVDCSAIVDLIPAYSLGATDPDERALVNAHLSRCPEAIVALADYAALTERLHYAVVPQQAPPLLASKLMDKINSPAPDAAQSRGRANIVQWWDRARRQWPWQYIAIAALLCLMATNFYWFKYIRDLNNSQNRVIETVTAQTMLLASFTEGKTQQVVLLPTGLSTQDNSTPVALLICDPQGMVGLLHVAHFPRSAAGTTYHLSFLRDQQPVEIISFNVTPEGTADAIFRAPDNIATFMRAEIGPGAADSNSPSTTPLVSGELYPSTHSSP